MIIALQRQRDCGDRSEGVNTGRTKCISYTTAHMSRLVSRQSHNAANVCKYISSIYCTESGWGSLHNRSMYPVSDRFSHLLSPALAT